MYIASVPASTPTSPGAAAGSLQRAVTCVCLCLLSYFPWFGVFEKALQVLELKSAALDEVRGFVDAAVQMQPLKLQGLDFSLVVSVPHKSAMRYTFRRPAETAPFGQQSFELLAKCLSPARIISALSALTRERRIIVVSSDLSRLSASIFALMSLLYPLHWQHIFIPILGHSLLNYCAAPMPFLVGIHTSSYEDVLKLPLEEVVFIMLDENKVTGNLDDEVVLPENPIQNIKHAINSIWSEISMGGYVKPDEIFQKDKQVIKGVEKFWLESIGQYRRYLTKDLLGKVQFGKEAFIKQAFKWLRPFLESITSMQMFEQFIEERERRIEKGEALNDSFEAQVDKIIAAPLPDPTSKLESFKSLATKAGNAIKAKVEDVKRSAAEFVKDEILVNEGKQTSPGGTKSPPPRPPMQRSNSTSRPFPTPPSSAPASPALPTTSAVVAPQPKRNMIAAWRDEMGDRSVSTSASQRSNPPPLLPGAPNRAASVSDQQKSAAGDQISPRGAPPKLPPKPTVSYDLISLTEPPQLPSREGRNLSSSEPTEADLFSLGSLRALTASQPNHPSPRIKSLLDDDLDDSPNGAALISPVPITPDSPSPPPSQSVLEPIRTPSSPHLVPTHFDQPLSPTPVLHPVSPRTQPQAPALPRRANSAAAVDGPPPISPRTQFNPFTGSTPLSPTVLSLTPVSLTSTHNGPAMAPVKNPFLSTPPPATSPSPESPTNFGL